MCLKEYHVFTFSNREAYERLLLKFPDYTKKPKEGTVKGKEIKGEIKVVKEFIGRGWQTMKEDWDGYSYEDLVNMGNIRHWFVLRYYRFWDWESLEKVVKMIGDSPYLFGKVTVTIY